jgi:hypothetical protein
MYLVDYPFDWSPLFIVKDGESHQRGDSPLTLSWPTLEAARPASPGGSQSLERTATKQVIVTGASGQSPDRFRKDRPCTSSLDLLATLAGPS